MILFLERKRTKKNFRFATNILLNQADLHGNEVRIKQETEKTYL